MRVRQRRVTGDDRSSSGIVTTPSTSGTSRAVRALFWIGALIVVAGLPLVYEDAFRLRILTLAWLYAALTIGLSISLGYAGLFNMSQGTFFGLGAYTTAILTGTGHLSFGLALVVSVLLTAVIGVALGATSTRVRGDYWALVSMAFTVAVYEALKNSKSLTGGLDGYFDVPYPLSIFGIHLETVGGFYYATFAVLVVSYLVVRRMTQSFTGRAMLSVKYDDSAASMMGVNPTYFKLLAMAVGSGLGGLAGAMLVPVSPFIHPSSFDLLPSFNITIFAVVGGSTNLIGGALAAVFLTVVVEQYRGLADYQLLIYGAALILAIFFRAGVFDPAFAAAWKGVRSGRARVQRNL